VSQPDPTGELPVTTAKPPARYGAIGGARPGGFALPSYTTTGDTTELIDPASQVPQTGAFGRILKYDFFTIVFDFLQRQAASGIKDGG
jgi:hypothetical protein